MNLYYVICFIAVFLGEVVAQDFSCIGQMSTVNPPNLTDGFDCEKLKDFSVKAMHVVQKCTSHEIDFTELKSVNEDMCNPDSDFSREFQRYFECIMEMARDSFARGSTSTCNDHWVNNDTHFTKEKCDSFVAETVECHNKMALQYCGDSGLKVSKRITEAHKPFTEIPCLALNSSVAFNDTTEPIYETMISELSSAEGRSLFTWLILMATVISVTWYQC